MYPGKIAFTPLHGHQSGGTADREQFRSDAAGLQFGEKKIESDAVTAHHDEVRNFESFAEQMHFNFGAGVDDFRLPRNGDEAIGAAEGGDRSRSFAHWKRGQSVIGMNHPTRRYSVRPISELVFNAIRAVTVFGVRSAWPPHKRMIGARNS